jgi:UDPglucose 6-dehydrogenase
LIIISSQLPVGSVAGLEDYALNFWPDKELIFACIPENLRLGQALKVFKEPDRLIAGVRSNETKNIIQALMSPFDMKIEWMSIESAEMTKHSINAFLAASITFANEIALICEKVGADAIEVARGLKTESRIGPAAYLSPGAPYAGGTLARDIKFLSDIGLEKKISIPVLSSVQKSNDEHKKWIQNKLRELFPEFKKLTVALWGLTYKPGTDTLRRSLSVELCEWLTSSGVDVRVFDPVINNLPQDLIDMHVVNCQDALDAVKSSNVLVIGTNWPQFIQDASFLKSTQTRDLIVIDATGFLREVLIDASIKYISVGHLQLRKLRNDE